MSLQPMYPAIPNSPATVTTGALSAVATEVAVGDSAVFGLDLPQLAVLGDGSNAETVLITAISGNLLTITRAVEGVAKIWAAGTVMARNFCALDHNTLIANINTLDGEVAALESGKLPIKKASTTSSGTDENKWFEILHIDFPEGYRNILINMLVASTVQAGKFGKLAMFAQCDSGQTAASGVILSWDCIYGFSPNDFVVLDYGNRSCGVFCRVPSTYMAYNASMLSEDGNAVVAWNQYAAAVDELPSGPVYTSTVAAASDTEYGITKLYDGLDSESDEMALTAGQGKVLNDKIGDIDTALDLINGEVV